MIDLQRHCSSADRRDIRIKVIGLGGAGSNALDRLILDGLTGAEAVAMNTDTQALASSVASEKVQLGRAATRGLGAGGDPEIGYAAAEESLEEIRAAVEGVPLIFLCVGLGGGTGSGAARLVASVARQLGGFVVSFATMPFAFEGRRRTYQAEEALHALQSVSDVVICYENDRMGEAVAPRAGIQEAFAVADQTISQSVRAVAALAGQRGIIHLGFDDLSTALRSGGRGASRCLFGFGEAEGDNRAHDALARALKSPLMEKGRLLEDAHSVLISVSGGATLTLNEVQILMEEFGRHVSDETQILFGATVDPRLGQKVGVTLISAVGASGAAPAQTVVPSAVAAGNGRSSEAGRAPVRAEASPAAVRPAAASRPAEPLRAPEKHTAPPAGKGRGRAAAAATAASVPLPNGEEKLLAEASAPQPAAASETPPAVEPAVSSTEQSIPAASDGASLEQPSLLDAPVVAASSSAPMPPRPRQAPAPAAASELLPAGPDGIVPAPGAPAAGVVRKNGRESRQEQMQFEPVTRGRFEKSEPTIVDGQDLDVPTFLRRNLKLK